jgi:hypothetical protein
MRGYPSHEQHSASDDSFINGDGAGHWEVTFRKQPLATFFRRQDARVFIRSLKVPKGLGNVSCT